MQLSFSKSSSFELLLEKIKERGRKNLSGDTSVARVVEENTYIKVRIS